MSKRRNKRNTRRGRAKRWTRETLCCARVMRRLRGSSFLGVWPSHDGSEWVVCDGPRAFEFATRVEAMRAAERLAMTR